MTDFELREHRGWAVYGQNPRTGECGIEVHFGARQVQVEEGTASYLARESQVVEEVTIRPVCLGADRVQWAAVQMALLLLESLRTSWEYIRGYRDGLCELREGMHELFGGSLEREEEEAVPVCPCHAVAAERCLADAARKPGCLCQWEEGDSPCPVHGEEEETS